jgi:(R,R)-butanediol dehydrogenase/meso-butanediol dehydrogenase/diacetyl reductase
MKGVKFLGDRKLVVESVADPSPRSDEVVVEVKAAGLCGSDLRVFRSPSEGGETTETIVGHEPCGIVVSAAGDEDAGWLGTRVVVSHHYGCTRCVQCRRGAPKHCSGPRGTYGVTDDGADAELMAVRTSALVPLPDELSFEDGAMVACCAGTAYVALARLGVSGRDTLVVTGQGPVGLSAVALGRAMGARVIAVDIVGVRLELAERNGADHVVNAALDDVAMVVAELTGGAGAHAVLECSGTTSGRTDAVRVAALRGRVCFVGNGPPTPVDISEHLIGKELNCYGSWTFTTTQLAEAADFVARSNTRLSDLVTHRFHLGDAQAAFDEFDRGDTGKCLFVDNQSTYAPSRQADGRNATTMATAQ